MENFELLKQLYCVHSKSGNEKKMRRFLKRWIKQNVSDAVVNQDKVGNLYITKGDAENYPCLCAHMDQVQDFHSKDFKAVETDDIIFGYSPGQRKFQGLGADDKNGIWVSLMCLQKYAVLKCAFFVCEEIGCVGSHQADMSFFDNCRFAVQIDRRGNSDLVTSISGDLCSDEFISDVDCKTWGYKESDGLMTDVDTLRQNGLEISCVNMSCGYYKPHTDEEYTVKEDLVKCLRFVEHIVESCQKVYPYKYEIPAWGYPRYGWRMYDRMYLHDEELADAQNELDYAFRGGKIKSKDDFDHWVQDYDGFWTTLKSKDYEILWEYILSDVMNAAADDAESIDEAV